MVFDGAPNGYTSDETEAPMHWERCDGAVLGDLGSSGAPVGSLDGSGRFSATSVCLLWHDGGFSDIPAVPLLVDLIRILGLAVAFAGVGGFADLSCFCLLGGLAWGFPSLFALGCF